MYQTLFHVPLEIFGLPVFGFGLLLAAWGVLSLVLIGWLLRRQGLTADTWGYVALLGLGAVIIGLLLPALCDWRGLPIRGYGVMNLLAVVAATGLTVWRGRRRGLELDLILSLAFWLFVAGILGARAFYVIEYWDEQYWPVYEQEGLGGLVGAVANVAQGGLVVYGTLMGVAPALILFARRHRLPLFSLADMLAPSVVLALALGRLGCLLNGCCFGGLSQLPWAVSFPFGSPSHVHQVRHGQTFLHGLKVFGDAQAPAVIADVRPGSPAQQQGLRPTQRIVEINGLSIDNVSSAQWALLNAHKLWLIVSTEDGRRRRWTLEDWPPSGKPLYRAREGRVSILGLELAGRGDAPPVIARVRRGSAAALAGLRPGERIAEISGRKATTIDAVGRLLEEHREAPWLTVRTAGSRAPVQWTITGPLPRSRRIHPTQVYSSINAMLLCMLLLAYEPFQRRSGELFLLMISIYPVARFLLEVIRVDESPVFHTPWSISQNISLILLLFAAGLWFYVLRQPKTVWHFGG